MKKFALLMALMCANVVHATDQPMVTLAAHKWTHGASICWLNQDPAIEVYQFSDTTYVLRQNKCTHYEAPFIYVLFGEHTVFVQDTGATADSQAFPLFDTIKRLVTRRALQQNRRYEDYQWLVTHSHSHSDHIAGDDQFRSKENVRIIEANLKAVQEAFGFDKARWPNEQASIDLGNRTLTIIPIPGHKADAVAVYDDNTQWLLTGDTIYPGRLYVKDWYAYRASMERLQAFSQQTPVKALMGTHIEMSATAGVDYKMGSTYQPDEAPLPMPVSDLNLLHGITQKNEVPVKVITERFIVYPVN